MLDDEDIEDGLAGVDIEGPQGDHVKRCVEARLFGGDEPEFRIGRFLVLDELGRGGMGTVFKGYDEGLDRWVAIKRIKDVLGPEYDERLQREAQALARLSHPNVVQVHEVGAHDGHTHIVMELVEGIDLAQWQREHRTWVEIVDTYRQAGRGLAAAHAERLVHRDFKPNNCIIDSKGRVRVADFGLARASAGPEGDARDLVQTEPLPTDVAAESSASGRILQHSLTDPGTLLGTHMYMAPEQRAHRTADARSDQFSFCVALYQALYGKFPFSDRPEPALLEMARGVQHRPEPPPRGRGVPRWVQSVVERGLRADPRARWPSMDALLQALERGRHRARRRTVGWSAVALVSVIGAGVVALTDRPCEDERRELEGTWGESQRERVAEAIVHGRGAGLEHGGVVVRRELDRYAEDWTRLRVRACEAARARVGAPAERVEQERCLRRRRLALQSYVDLLAGSASHAVDDAVTLVTQLPPLDACVDVERLMARRDDAEPDDPRELERLRGALEHVRGLNALGRSAEGIDELAPTLARAVELDHPSLSAEAYQLKGRLLVSMGEHEDAVEPLERARALGLAHEAATESAVRAMADLIHVQGVEQNELGVARASSWVEELAARRDIEPAARAEVLTSIAQIYTLQDEHAEAQSRYAEAVELLEQRRGPHHFALVDALDSWGAAAHRRGDLGRAESLFRRALMIREAWQGPEHEATHYGRVNLAGVLQARGDHGRAEQLYLVALAAFTEAEPPNPKRLAVLHGNLGACLAEQGRYAEAEEHVRAAIGWWERAGQGHHPRAAMMHFSLGYLLEQQRRLAEAAGHYQRVQQILGGGESTPRWEALRDKARTRSLRLLLGAGP